MKVSLNTLTIAAFRYALGRKTYIVEDVTNDIMNNINNIPDSYLKRIKEEIIEAKNENRIGMKMDEKLWMELLNKINEKLKEN